MKGKRLILSIAVIALLIGGLVYGVLRHQEVCVGCFIKSINAEVIRYYIEGFGKLAIVVYVALYVVNTFTPFIPPIFILSLLAGALFGPLLGTVALTLGTFCGTTAAFFVSRYIGRSWVERIIQGKGAQFYEKLSSNGFFILLPMRLIGLPPYGIIDFICGLSKMRYFDFISATMIGAIPWILLQVLLADRVTEYTTQFQFNSLGTWFDPVLVGLFVAFVAMVVITGKIVKKKQSEVKNAEI